MACKPGSVHAQFVRWMVIHLRCPLPDTWCDRPGRRPGKVPAACCGCRPYLVLLPVGFTMPPLLPGARCALAAPFHPCCCQGRSGLLSVALSLGSPPPDVIRHRFSVEPGLSSPRHHQRWQGATIRPSGEPDHRAFQAGVKQKQSIRGSMARDIVSVTQADKVAVNVRVFNGVAAVVFDQALFRNVCVIGAFGIFCQKMVERLVFRRAHLLGYGQPPFLCVGENRVYIINHAAEREDPVPDNLANFESCMAYVHRSPTGKGPNPGRLRDKMCPRER